MKTRLPTSQLVISLLNSASFQKNAKEYALAKRPCFALLKIGGEVVEDELDTLAQTCAFLTDVGLLPAIVHGGGPQMNRELSKRGIKPQYVRGNRVTDMETLNVAVSVFTELNERVTAALNKAGAPARALPSGVFRSKVASPELGLVGEVVGVEVEKVQQALKAREIPVLTSLGFSATEPNLNINADVAARELALAIQPNRVVYTSAKGGWVDDDTKKIVPKIVLSRDFARLAGLNYEGRQGTLLKLNEIKALLDGLPNDAAVTIANAGGILTELFAPSGTGSGTTFTKGEKTPNLVRFDSIGAVDLGRLSRLFPADATSTDNLARYQNLEAVVVGDPDDYSCAAIATKEPVGGYVLEQIAVPATAASAFRERLISEFPGGLAWKVRDMASDPLLSNANGMTKVNNQAIAWFGNDWNEVKAKNLAQDTKAHSEMPPASRWTAPISEKSTVSRKKDVKVGLLGARGYVGREVVKLISQHPRLDLAIASSRALVGKSVAQEFNVTSGIDSNFLFETLEGSSVESHPLAKDIDVWVLALPNGLAPKWIEPLVRVGRAANKGTGALMIDLGADFRFTDEWTYGLPERKGAREKIRGTRKIANPGCYATGAQTALMPLIHHKLVTDTPSVFGLSGYSGAGTTPSDKNNPLFLRDNIIPYALVKHMHEREVSRHCDHRIAFMPHVAPFFQGIALTVSAHLNKDFSSTKEIAAMYEEFYKNEPLIKVYPGEAPRVRDNMTQHHVSVGGFTWDEKNRRLAMHATIDNLMKGAATQAIQNINIALGFDEELAGIYVPK
jgi:N-acetyl-gamma-glutamyl-phosphate reductase/acetylglutamate kinase